MKRVIKESQLRKLIRRNLVALSESVSDELMMEMHGLLMEEEMGWYETYKTIKMVFTILGLVLAVCVILVAIGTVTAGTGGGFIAALLAAAASLNMPLTIVGIMNFCLSIINHEKNEEGKLEHKPEWFDAIMNLSMGYVPILKLFKGGMSGLTGLGKQGKLILKLSKMNLNEGVLSKVIDIFELKGLSWDIINPLKDAWSNLNEGVVNKKGMSMISELSDIGSDNTLKKAFVKPESVSTETLAQNVDWVKLKNEFDKDTELHNFANGVSKAYNLYKSSDKKKNEIFAKKLIEIYKK